MNKFISLAVGAGLVILVVVSFSGKIQVKPTLGSVSVGGEYQATTTSGSVGNFAPAVVVLCPANSGGTLGSVFIGTTAAGLTTFYDATTSVLASRTIQATSSQRVLAAFGASPAVGVYTFDTVFFSGLLVSTAGAQGTSTITYRCNN